jgi:hypothetical protein
MQSYAPPNQRFTFFDFFKISQTHTFPLFKGDISIKIFFYFFANLKIETREIPLATARIALQRTQQSRPNPAEHPKS